MDLIMAEKLQAMNSYKKAQFLNKLILHSFTALICVLFCCYHSWFSTVRLVMSHFVFVSIPNFNYSFFFSPKCLFLVGNAIVAILVVESKLTAASHYSSSATNVYDEYVERSQSLRGAASKLQEKEEERKEDICLAEDESVNKIEEVKHTVYIEKEKSEIVDKNDDDHKEDDDHHHHKEEEEEEEREEREVEEEPGLPTEELNKKVEEFIARVNRQRWLEEKLLVWGKA